jgi:uridine kinase
MSDIQVRIVNALSNNVDVKNCPVGTGIDTMIGSFSGNGGTIIAMRVNNEICPLQTRLEVNSTLEPVFLDSPEGAMIYRRSLAFLLAVAAREIFPDRSLYVGHSLGNSYYYTFNSDEILEKKEITALEEDMKALVAEDLPITFKFLAYEEALEVFAKNRQTDTALLLDQRSTSRIKVNECKGFLDIYVEPLVPRTGLLSFFELMPYQEGFLLRFPHIGRGTDIGPFEDEPGIFDVYRQYKNWGRMVGVRVVGNLNSLVANRTIHDYIRIAESHQSRKMADIAEQIYEKRESVKMVLLAGPSSSGKTTSAKRLSI